MAVHTVHFKSLALQRSVPYTVFTPDRDIVGPGPYAVLLQLHGYWDDHRSWSLKSRLWEHTERMPLVVVMPNGENGFYYNHYPPLMYEDMIVKDLWDHVRGTLPVREGPWAIGGLSMGGYGTLRLGLKHPDKFCSVWAHSSFIPGEDFGDPSWAWNRADFSAKLRKGYRTDLSVQHWARQLPAGRRPRLAFDCGTEDFLIEHNRSFHAYLDEIGFEHTYAEHPGGHTWEYWDTHVHAALAQHCAVLGIEPVPPQEWAPPTREENP